MQQFRMRSVSTLFALVIALAVCTPGIGFAQDGKPQPVDVELVLAVDVSWSMDADEQRLQRDGYAAAFRDPLIIQAIVEGGWGAISVTYFEWAGTQYHRMIVPWTVIKNAQTARAFADKLVREPIGRLRRTSISGAMVAARDLFKRNPFKGLRRVIDISGDGANNEGFPVEPVRDILVNEGTTINGLPIMIKRGGPGSFFSIANLDEYYRDCVIGGTGAFFIPVTDKRRFTAAIRRKLLLEIAGRQPRIIFAQSKPPGPRADCLIGEKRWREWQERGENYFMVP